jgi:hypothetical protein
MLLASFNSKRLCIDREAVGVDARELAPDACRSTTVSVNDPDDSFNS